MADIEKAGQKAAALQLDIGNTKTFEAFFTRISAVLKDHFGASRFDFLVNNAGIGIHASFAETTEELFDQLVNVHFKGVFFLTQKALALINDGGRIVNLSTGLPRFSTPGYAAYAVMKGAIETLTRYQAKELGSRGIAVNTVAPGAIETDFGGGVVAFLCTEEARWINAQRIEVSGGMNL